MRYAHTRRTRRTRPTPSVTRAGEPALVATVLTPIERVRVDVAAQGVYNAIHRTRIDEVVNDLRQERVSAVLVSVSRYDPAATARMAAMVREFPRVPTYALLTDVHKSTPYAVHALGQIGVHTLVDVRQPSGWASLRERLSHEQPKDLQRIALAELAIDLAGASPDCWRFFEVLLSARPPVSTVRQLARALYIHPTTLMSRFYRAKLPSPKSYIDMSRLMRAAHLLENKGVSIAAMTRQLDYSSAQAFGRHVKHVSGLTAAEFRQEFTGDRMLARFRCELVLPYVQALRTFRPVTAAPGWITSEGVDSRS